MLLGDLSLDANPALHALQSLSGKIEGFEHGIKNLGKSLAGFALIGEGIGKVAEGFEHVLELGAHMQALHLATGETVHDLVIFGQALDITGGHADQAQTFIFKLQNAIAGVNEDGKSTTESLKLLGTSAAELRNLPLLDQVHKISEGVQNIGDQATKVAAIKELFGFRFAAQALPLLANPHALEEAAKQSGSLADVLDKSAESFHELEVAMKGAGLIADKFFAGALSKLAPAATDIANAIASIDFVSFGEAFGDDTRAVLELVDAMMPLVKATAAFAQALSQIDGRNLLRVLDFIGGGDLLYQLFEAMVPRAAAASHKSTFADAFRGLDAPPSRGKEQVSALQRIGLGGGWGGGGNDPILTEAQRQTAELRGIHHQVARLAGANGKVTSHPTV